MPFIEFTDLPDWFRRLWQRRYAVKPLSQSIASLQAWFGSDLGMAILAEEQKALNEILPCLFGYHLMQLSVTPTLNLSPESKMNHQFNLAPGNIQSNNLSVPEEGEQDLQAREIAAIANFEQLPLAKESVDLAIVHHALDFSSQPHQLLREVSKTIIPHGYLVIVGFNPFSWTGMIKPFKRLFCCNAIWRRHSLRKGRIIDWLRLLDFEPLECYQGFFRLPVNHKWSLEYFEGVEALGQRWKWPLGSYYILLARKDTYGVTPINPKWRTLGVAPIMPVAHSANRVSSESHGKKGAG